MKNIRYKVFETNSSSSHVFTSIIERHPAYPSLPVASIITPISVWSSMIDSRLYQDRTFLSLEEKIQVSWIYFMESFEWDDEYEMGDDEENLKKTDKKFIEFLKSVHPNFEKVEIVLERTPDYASSFPECVDEDSEFFKKLILDPNLAITFFSEWLKIKSKLLQIPTME